MTKLELLKKQIEAKKVTDSLIIFNYTDNDFICVQYIKAIAKIKQKAIYYLESLDSLFQVNIFGETDYDENALQVFRCVELLELDERIKQKQNLIIVASKIDKSIKETYSEYIYDVPKLESWQIKDYVYSTQQPIAQDKLNLLIDKCHENIYRIDSELSKLNVFSNQEKPSAFNDFVIDGVFSDISKYNIYNLTNAIIKHDINALKLVYIEKDNIDIEPIGVVTLLLNSFRDIIRLQLDPRLTPETSGIAKNKFYAIKYNCGIYSNAKLIEIFKLLCDMDKRIKTGTIDVSRIVDYLIIKILS